MVLTPMRWSFYFGDRADSPEFTHWQGAEDVGFLIFGDDIEPVGFGHAGGDFGALLAGAHTMEDGKPVS